MFESIHDMIRQPPGHNLLMSRGLIGFYIEVECSGCEFFTRWMPDEDTRQVAKRWNRKHHIGV